MLSSVVSVTNAIYLCVSLVFMPPRAEGWGRETKRVRMKKRERGWGWGVEQGVAFGI